MARFTSPAEWLPFDTVMRQYERGNYDGVGLVLGDGLCGLDEDHCIAAGKLNDEAARHIKLLNSYAEESVSGDGVHVLAYGTLPTGRCRQGNHELYSAKRFFVVTGRRLASAPRAVKRREKELHRLHSMIFRTPRDGAKDSAKKRPTRPEGVTQFGTNTQRGRGGRHSGSVEHGDERVIALLMKDPIARRYWEGGCPNGTNPSGADFALACKLAFYTRRDLLQMERLFRLSPLAKRPKAQMRRDYIRRTLERACQSQVTVYKPRRQAKPHRSPGRPTSRTTRRVIKFAIAHPTMQPAEIARSLGLPPGTVRVVLHRHPPSSKRASVERAA
jgi:putative DNA primase/helicase